MLGSNKMVGFIASKELKRSRDFYERVLGLRFVKDDGFALVFEAGGRMLRIADVTHSGNYQPPPFTVLGWEVKDIRATASALRERGVNFERFSGMEQDELGVWAAPGGDKVTWFKDPDGNMLSLSSHA